jgi:hypothetical protein
MQFALGSDGGIEYAQTALRLFARRSVAIPTKQMVGRRRSTRAGAILKAAY